MSAYGLHGASAPEKSRAWNALTCVEKDLLETLYEGYRSWPNVHSIIHESPLGLVTARAGGLPMKLRYFVAPHDLVDQENNKLRNLRYDKKEGK